jgi:hypothetical protein
MFRLGTIALAVLFTLPLNAATIVTGTDSGVPAQVNAFEGASPTAAYSPYGTFTGGVRVGAADVNHDGIADIITGAGPGASGGHVKVFDGQTGSEIRSFFSFTGFTGGVFVAGGDMNHDGFAEIVVGTDAGAAGEVKVFDGQTNTLLNSFFAYAPSFTGGVRVGAADVNNDGVADIITGAGAGATGGHVKVFNGQTGSEIRSFFSFDGFTGGIFVAAGDINRDGFAEIIAGADGGLGGHVKVFDGQTNNLVNSFFAYGSSFTGGVRVAAGDVNQDGAADIITGAGPGEPGGHVQAFDGQSRAVLHSFLPYSPSFTDGVFVAGTTVPEPSSALLLALGLLAVVRQAARSKSRATT